MKEEFVGYSQAVALKECGFDMNQWQGGNYVEETPVPEEKKWDSYVCQWVTPCYIKLYPKLRLDQAQKWLRDEKGVDIDIRTHFIGHKRYDFVVINGTRQIFAKESYDSYESALADGITQALELIKQK